ncbi:MAG: AAA family ATPase [Flavisolibacter sp.]
MAQTKVNQATARNLVNDIKCFAETLPNFAKYLSKKILSGEEIGIEELQLAYDYFKEEFGLKTKVHLTPIQIDCFQPPSSQFKEHIQLTRLENVEGVNALVSNQVIEFNPGLTIIYGVNGSGKSGYTRLLKKAFFSRDKEDISPNIYQEEAIRPISADFYFISNGNAQVYKFPTDKGKAEFLQFAVFDKKCALTHLDGKNEYEFKPAGLQFFPALIEQYKKIEALLLRDIQEKNRVIEFQAFFTGESEIKHDVQRAIAERSILPIEKYVPFTDEDQALREKLQTKRAFLVTSNTDKEINRLTELKSNFLKLEQYLRNTNKYFTTDSINKVQAVITECIEKGKLFKEQGKESFKALVNYSVDNIQWVEFIEAAGRYADSIDTRYPMAEDKCLLCQQPLTPEASQLIHKYWEYLESEAEKNFKTAQERLEHVRKAFMELNLNLLPEENICHQWLKDNDLEHLQTILIVIENLNSLKNELLLDLATLTVEERTALQVEVTKLQMIQKKFEEAIVTLMKSNIKNEIAECDRQLTLLDHKDKLNQLLDQLRSQIENLSWAALASRHKGKLGTQKITLKEKEISKIYFHEDYINTFQKECLRLDGDFGISIVHTGTFGSSYRQLNILSHHPSKILSEGEQKVISLADFLSEIAHSNVNRGILFDDPVTSLDDERKSTIAKRLVEESSQRQVIILTHDLVFVYNLMDYCRLAAKQFSCHWIEKQNNKPGYIHLNNAPSLEKEYRNSTKALEHYSAAKKLGPEAREERIRQGFTALRTSYEVLVVHDFFNGVVQRFIERVSIDSMGSICLDRFIRDEIMDNFAQCCSYMEGHSHSDKYAYKKPSVENLLEEIQRFDALKKKIKESKKQPA